MIGTHQDNLNQPNRFYRDYYNALMLAITISMMVLIVLVSLLVYQLLHRPLPPFFAVSNSGQQIQLTAFSTPNLYPDTIIKWASKAAVAAYTFDFANYSQQTAAARPYFTDVGWSDFQASLNTVINAIVQKQLIVSSVVSGTPIITNQGDLLGRYTWRLQIPFLVTYQAAQSSSQSNYTVIITIVKVPTSTNPTGIGIEQFVMA